MGRGQHLGPLPRQVQLRLAPGETVLQVGYVNNIKVWA